MLKFIAYMAGIIAAVTAALGLGVLITWMIFYGLWYVALILMAIVGVWLGSIMSPSTATRMSSVIGVNSDVRIRGYSTHGTEH